MSCTSKETIWIKKFGIRYSKKLKLTKKLKIRKCPIY